MHKIEVRISETEYHKLQNLAKLNAEQIDREAYKIAEKLNKIEVLVEVEQSGYGGSEFNVSLNGTIDKYCLKTTEYREMPEDLRRLLRVVSKDLQARFKRQSKPYAEKLDRLQVYNMRIFLIAMLLGFTNIITLLILLLK